jgi:hypothetical protein
MLIDLPEFTLGKQCSAVAAAIIFLLVDVDVAMVGHGSESKGPSLLQVGENDIFEPFKWRITVGRLSPSMLSNMNLAYQ